MRSNPASDLRVASLNNAVYSMVPSSLANNRMDLLGCNSVASSCLVPKRKAIASDTPGPAIKKRSFLSSPLTAPISYRSGIPSMSTCEEQHSATTIDDTSRSKSTATVSQTIPAYDSYELAIVTTTEQPRSQSHPCSTSQKSRATTSNVTNNTPKPLQFINNVAPAIPRPKQPAAGTYVQTQSAIQQKARKQLRDEGKTKRPSNCFIKYRARMHPVIVARYGNQNNKEISKLAGQCWREEPEWVKSFFRQQALEEQQLLKSLYPEYKYNPPRSSKSKGKNVKSDSHTSKDKSDPSSADSSPISNNDSTFERTVADNDGVANHATDPGEEYTAKISTKDTSSSRPPSSKAKQDKERKFVVTETALHEFIGDSDPTTKNRNSTKSRACSRLSGHNIGSNPISVRQQLLAENPDMFPSTESSRDINCAPETSKAATPQSNSTNVITDQPESTPFTPCTMLVEDTLSTTNSWGLDDLGVTEASSHLITNAQDTVQRVEAQSSINGAFATHAHSNPSSTNCNIMDNAIDLFATTSGYSSVDTNNNNTELLVHDGRQQGLSLDLDLHSTAMGSVHSLSQPIHDPFSTQQLQAAPGPCVDLGLDLSWDINVMPKPVALPLNLQHDSMTQVPTLESSIMSSQQLSFSGMLSASPITPMLTPILSMSTTKPVSVLDLPLVTEAAGNTNQVPSSAAGHHHTFVQDQAYPTMATSGSGTEWLTIPHSLSVAPGLLVSQQTQQQAQQSQQQQQEQLMPVSIQTLWPPLLPASSTVCNITPESGGNGTSTPDAVAIVPSTMNYMDYMMPEWVVPSQTGSTQLPMSIDQKTELDLGSASQLPSHFQVQNHLLMSSFMHGCSVEELSMSIEYYERLIELQKIQLAQLQMNQTK